MDAYRIVLVDGECSLCSGTVRWVARHDREGRFRFATLQSEIGRELAIKCGCGHGPMSSLVLMEGRHCHTKSTAALRILGELGVPWKIIATLLMLIPRFIRDWMYDCIARNRYRFGNTKICDTMPLHERWRFLDLP